MRDDDKRAAAEAAVNEVQAGMLVGLGTGSTAAHAIRLLGERAGQGLRIDTVATSDASAALARSLGLPVRDFADVARLDLTIDGVDEIDPACRAIKGAGGAMVREKIVAAASRRMIAIADAPKRVERLGAAKLPVEVLPFARSFVASALVRLGLQPVMRGGEDAPFRTDGGNIILDALGMRDADPARLASALDSVPGVVGHGLFLSEIDAAYVAGDGIVTRMEPALPTT